MVRAYTVIRAMATTSQAHTGTVTGRTTAGVVVSSRWITSSRLSVRMGMQRDGGAHPVLVAGERGAVGAAVAVHADVAFEGLVVALEDQAGHAGVGTQFRADADVDGRVLGVPGLGLVVDSVDEHTGEQ